MQYPEADENAGDDDGENQISGSCRADRDALGDTRIELMRFLGTEPAPNGSYARLIILASSHVRRKKVRRGRVIKDRGAPWIENLGIRAARRLVEQVGIMGKRRISSARFISIAKINTPAK